MYWHLVVTGPQRGHVWLIDENGAMPFGTSSNASPMPGTSGFTGWATQWAEGRSRFAVLREMIRRKRPRRGRDWP